METVFCPLYLRLTAPSAEEALNAASQSLEEALAKCAPPNVKARLASLHQVYLRPGADGSYQLIARVEFQGVPGDLPDWLTLLPEKVSPIATLEEPRVAAVRVSHPL